jgi:hypothetical protein
MWDARGMMQRVQTFAAEGSDGWEYIIDAYENADTPKGAVARKLLLRDGRNVQRIGKGRYEVGDVILTTDDPHAP